MAKSKSTRKRERARIRNASGSTSARTAEGSTRAAGTSPVRAAGRTPANGGRPDAGEAGRTRYRETSGRDWRHTAVYIVVFFGSVVVAFTVVAPRRGPFLAGLLILVSLWTLVAWHNRAFAYRCANCRRVFQVPTLVNFLTFQGVSRRPDGTYRGWKMLTCPHCQQRTKAAVVRKVELTTRGPKAGSPGSDARLLH